METDRPRSAEPTAAPPPTPLWPEVDATPPTATLYLCAPAGWYASLKPTFDLLAAAVLTIILFPFMLLAWAAIKLTSPGPGVYTQTRTGRGGRDFRIFKIRSMHHTPANADNLAWATRGDTRVTVVGRVLRALHLDELPQLVNVLRGEMSLVGPRPERPEVISTKGLPDEVAGYALRSLVRPGVTGLAQIQVPADSDVTSVKHKVYYDLYYLTHQSVWLDVRIGLGTVLKCFLRAETIRKVLLLPTREQVCEHFLSLLAAPEPDSRVAPIPVV